MSAFSGLGRTELAAKLEELAARYEEFRARGLRLDMTRGRPSPEQLDLSVGMLSCVAPEEYAEAGGIDCRNYGGLDGLPAARSLFAEYLQVQPDEIIVAGNSSLELMHDAVALAVSHGVPGGTAPWRELPSVKFLCPCPGYDRHFAICEHFGIDMVPVDVLADGPDMDAVEELAGGDELVKAIWCTPKYSNPTGITYSDRVVDRLAGLGAKAPDFRVFWDNAYAVHDLTDEARRLKDMMAACRAAGNADRIYIFGSTSKVTFAGAGIALLAASERNIEDFRRHLRVRTIGPDKMNQLRHVRFLKDMDGIRGHMRKHARILRPRFQAVDEVLRRELGDSAAAEWSKPDGGYFISLDVVDGCARRVVQLCAEAGAKFTPAGATFPYGRDPRDRNIRIAPTLPPLEEVCQATELLAVCVQIAAIEKQFGQHFDVR
jgi:DNA-binding transcriptional MocR family regulator